MANARSKWQLERQSAMKLQCNGMYQTLWALMEDSEQVPQ